MITKSIRLTEAEATDIAAYVKRIGGTEAALLKEAMLRGLREMRLARGILAFIEGASSSEAAEVAGLPRGPFLWELTERGVPLLTGPSTVKSEVEAFLVAQTAVAKRRTVKSTAKRR